MNLNYSNMGQYELKRHLMIFYFYVHKLFDIGAFVDFEIEIEFEFEINFLLRVCWV